MNGIYPKAIIPLTPLLGDKHPKRSSSIKIPSVFDMPNAIQTTSGRAALAIALKHAGLKTGDETLIPSYHCEAMVAPTRWLDSKAVFYKIKPDVTADIEDIKNKLTPKTKALIVTHYFGFQQNLKEIRQLCDQHKIVLIEDCAHAFFGSLGQQAIGQTGDYCIASSMKFFPVYEGGGLYSAKKDITQIEVESPRLKFQLKSLINILEKSIGYKRLGTIGKGVSILLKLKDILWRTFKKQTNTTLNNTGPSSSDGGYGLDPQWIYKAPSLATKLIIDQADFSYNANKRRENYQKIDLALSKLPNCHPLHPEGLKEQTVPFAYPLYIEDPSLYFPIMKDKGIPIWRFGEYLDKEVTELSCPISTQYSQHIFQFPCHQSLTEQELDWMIDNISQILKDN